METTVEHDVCALDDISDGGKKVEKLAGVQVLLLRKGKQVFAINNRCPHMKLPLSVGSFDGTHIKCRFHGSRYDVRTGQRDTRAWLIGSFGDDCVPTYPVTVRNGRVFVQI